MPIEHEVDVERRLVRTRAWGRLTGDEVIAGIRRLEASPEFRPDFAQLADMSSVTQVEISPHQMGEIADSAPFAAEARRAGVASSDLQFGMLRMYEGHSDVAATIRVFRSIREAEAWLGLDLVSPEGVLDR